jgi:hypothetical protein
VRRSEALDAILTTLSTQLKTKLLLPLAKEQSQSYSCNLRHSITDKKLTGIDIWGG